jgi:hypothetical protein
MPKEISPKSLQKAESEFWYGSSNDDPRWLEQHGKRLGRWNSDFNTSFLNDFDRLLILLHTEEYELSLKYKEGEIPRPTTKLDRVQKIWEELLPHRTLIKRAGTIETHPYKKPELKYSSSQMSDGERVIFYLIGEVVCSRSNSLIIIDEPEMHLHKSICCKLWDLLENERKDCAFIYLTHDIDFAVSRVDSLKIWAKSYEGNNSWDYEIIDTISALPSDIFLEILGSRKPVLFIEGEKSSIDYFLYSSVFKDFTIKSIGSCEKVIDSTKTFNDLNGFHHIEAYGLIDRDTRTDEEITHIKDNKILDRKSVV